MRKRPIKLVIQLSELSTMRCNELRENVIKWERGQDSKSVTQKIAGKGERKHAIYRSCFTTRNVIPKIST